MILANRRSGRRWGRRTIPKEVSAQRHALHERLQNTLNPLIGKKLTVTSIVDLMNHIGKCVVSGNVRRTAEIAFGEPDSEEYIDLKDFVLGLK